MRHECFVIVRKEGCYARPVGYRNGKQCRVRRNALVRLHSYATKRELANLYVA